MASESSALERLEAVLRECQPASIAVSGGVDSMTLAFIAGRTLGTNVAVFHAVSPAVPPAATARVRAYAERERWQLQIIDAGEFNDQRYLENPSNRCFFCKTNLYGSIARHTANQILSGTNLDDLEDWRPGLAAARNRAVRHPFVEAAIDKAGVRALAHSFDLTDIAELPAAPCLSSRVETGIPIAATQLRFIDTAERFLRASVLAHTVRCRIRSSGIVIELDAASYAALDDPLQAELIADLTRLAQEHGIAGTPAFAPYERGSAFLKASL